MVVVSVPLGCKDYLLFLVSLVFWAALLRTAPALPLRNSNPIYQFDGQVRLRHLYTADEQTHLHLEILPDGTVGGSRFQNPFSLMEIKAVKPGVIRMQAKKTSRFLCMKPNGRLYGSLFYSEEACNFHEKVLSDGYNLYYSENYNIPVSLSSAGNLGQSRQLPPFSQFLPLVNKIPLEPVLEDFDFYGHQLDVESADPLSILGQNPGFMSPSYVFG
ncbi:fibroblast growth factor 21 [Anolis carolinensis]|uniref:Fibroblast growth factor n=1 Tax=Anolis carolinensis TaxID=28377 RepID=R4GC04_ANOCA|nr:PREDICTED: fibroblast growth factor 21 [Anolis carolinensis]|eukprot:XP_016852196.1 PREDICTED: fibroblast growth factor 21 [Anolis carolinensis]